MRKVKVQTNLPAYLSDFVSEPNEKFSRAKLKVFYIGETADKRLFTEKFAKKVIKTLPYTPVVSSYDADEDDFVGHAAEQNIYGIVDPCGKITFEEEDGQTWATCDVVLYTERPDSTGKIASKIVGKQHSLELDPKTVRYTVNYDSKKKLKNIEFLDGEFVGVSVLGDKQKPAFSGSHFFKASQRGDFEAKMDILRDYCENKRGNDMDVTILNFVELSWSEQSKLVYKALEEKFGQYCIYPVEWYNDKVITYIYSEETQESALFRVDFSINEDGNQVELAEPVKVRVEYVDVVEPAEVSEATDHETEDVVATEDVVTPAENGFEEVAVEEPIVVEEPVVEEEPVVQVEEVVQAENQDAPANEDVQGDAEASEAAAEPTFESNPPSEELNPIDINNEEGATAKQNEATASANPSTFTESEREELEALRKQQKQQIIASYEEDLPQEILDQFMSEIDNFDAESLEAELAKKYRSYSKENKKVQPVQSTMRTFSFTPVVGVQTRSQHLADLVNRYKTK